MGMRFGDNILQLLSSNDGSCKNQRQHDTTATLLATLPLGAMRVCGKDQEPLIDHDALLIEICYNRRGKNVFFFEFFGNSFQVPISYVIYLLYFNHSLTRRILSRKANKAIVNISILCHPLSFLIFFLIQ